MKNEFIKKRNPSPVCAFGGVKQLSNSCPESARPRTAVFTMNQDPSWKGNVRFLRLCAFGIADEGKAEQGYAHETPFTSIMPLAGTYQPFKF